jgi:hypothetical protein
VTCAIFIFQASSVSSETSNKTVTIRLKQYVVSHRGSIPYEAEFNENLMEAREAIRKGIYPQLITSGSSGTFFLCKLD